MAPEIPAAVDDREHIEPLSNDSVDNATLRVEAPLNGCALSGEGERIVAAGARGVYFLKLVR